MRRTKFPNCHCYRNAPPRPLQVVCHEQEEQAEYDNVDALDEERPPNSARDSASAWEKRERTLIAAASAANGRMVPASCHDGPSTTRTSSGAATAMPTQGKQGQRAETKHGEVDPTDTGLVALDRAQAREGTFASASPR